MGQIFQTLVIQSFTEPVLNTYYKLGIVLVAGDSQRPKSCTCPSSWSGEEDTCMIDFFRERCSPFLPDSPRWSTEAVKSSPSADLTPGSELDRKKDPGP